MVSTVLELEECLVAGTGEADKYQDKDSSECTDDSECNSANEDSNIESIAGDSVSDCQSELSDAIKGSEVPSLVSPLSVQNSSQVEEYLESEYDYSTPSWCIWNGAKERRSWQKDLSSARLLSHVAYSVLSLSESAVPAMKDYYKMSLGKKMKE